jgi:ABC-type transport system involved in multi-copper enzyme maturation permease subunit
MKLQPVIVRELRAQARQPATFGLRMFAVLAVGLAAWFFSADHTLSGAAGSRLFAHLHLVGTLLIWALVPLATADCISRERREGTLGLLFLTPLQPYHIVIAKGMVHGWRAMMLLLAIVPVLTIPFLMGGISWGQAVASVIINASGILWALAAALLASALGRSAAQAMGLAMGFAGLNWLIYSFCVGAVLGASMSSSWQIGYSQPFYDLLVGNAVLLMSGGGWSAMLRVLTVDQILFAVTFGLGVAGLALVLAIIVAARRIRSSWREEPPSLRLMRAQKLFCEPVLAVNWLRRWMRYKLERNPLGWLEQRRWQGRMVSWVWFAIVVSIFSLVLTERNFFRGTSGFTLTMGWLVLVSIAVSAAGSFRRERETGVLELLLVSPLKTEEIIAGRLRGLWGQFFPATVMFLGVWIYLEEILPSRDHFTGAWIFYFAVAFLVTPMVGLYFSVRSRSFLTALGLTLGAVVVGPWSVSLAWDFLVWVNNSSTQPWRWQEANLVRQAVFVLGLGVYLYHRLCRELERRAFPLERALE